MFVKSAKERGEGLERRAEKFLRIHFFVLMDSWKKMASEGHMRKEIPRCAGSARDDGF
jgi:hypothetical protein